MLNTAQKVHSAKANMSTIHHNPLKVLMIEDNKICQLAQTKILQKLGCQVDVASTGTEGLEMYNTSYDLIVLDIELPDIMGYVVSQKIKSSQTGKDTIIIGVSSCADSMPEVCLLAGYNVVITKFEAGKKLPELLSKFFPNKVF